MQRSITRYQKKPNTEPLPSLTLSHLQNVEPYVPSFLPAPVTVGLQPEVDPGLFLRGQVQQRPAEPEHLQLQVCLSMQAREITLGQVSLEGAGLRIE